MSIQQQPETWREHFPTGLMTTLGPLLSKRHEDGWLYGLKIHEKHLNPAGVAHGGIITTLMDHAFSAMAWHVTEKKPCITVQLNTSFIRPAYLNDVLVVNSTLTRKTSSILFVTGDIHVDDNVIATGQAILKMLPSR